MLDGFSYEDMVELVVAKRRLENMGLAEDVMKELRRKKVLVEDFKREETVSIVDDHLKESEAKKGVISFNLTNAISAKKDEYEYNSVLKQICLNKKIHECTTRKKGSLEKAERIYEVLKGLRTNVFSKMSSSLRQIYYDHPRLYSALKHDQNLSNSDVTDISTMMGVTMQSLNIFTSPTGVIQGPVLLYKGDKILADFRMGGIAGNQIPAEVHNCKIRCTGEVRYIVVLEKEDAFESLSAEHFWERNHCIIFSGKGQPSGNSRLFLRMLRDELGVPIYSVLDGNHGGAQIHCTYKFGSKNRSYDSLYLTIPDLIWLGVFPDDVNEENRTAMSEEDQKKLSTLINSSQVNDHPELREQLRKMQAMEQECNLEMIKKGGSSLSKYIERKVKLFAEPAV